MSSEAARHVYKVAWDETDRRVDLDKTAELRTQELLARKARGRGYDEFEAAWLKQKPRDEILTYYGSWPDAREVAPLLRA